jgi:anthranilate phosphoribosyltransferase
MPLIAGALASLGSVHALVVHGEPGLDEISPLGITRVVEVREGGSHEWAIDPGDFGYRDMRADELRGGDPAQNADAVVEVLSGKGTETATAAVLLNAAAAIYVAGDARSYGEAFTTARDALYAGAGLAALDRLRGAHTEM